MVLLRMSAAALLGLLSISTAAFAQQAEEGPPAGTTVVYLRSAEIVQKAPGSAEAQRTFEREITEWRAELQRQATAVDSLMQEYQRQGVLLSPQAKQEKEQEIREKQNELAGKQRELETQAQQRQQELLRPILEKISNVIEQIRSEKEYAIVLDASSEGVVAADTTLDITGMVLARLAQGEQGSE